MAPMKMRGIISSETKGEILRFTLTASVTCTKLIRNIISNMINYTHFPLELV